MSKQKLTRFVALIAAFVLAFTLFAAAACVPEADETDKALESIAVTTQPSKTEYHVGDTFSKDGMVVTATYKDKTSKAVTGYTVTPSGPLALTDKKVTVSYTENKVTKTADVSITVTEAPAAAGKIKSIEAAAKTGTEVKLEYKLGDTFDASNIEVKAIYDNGASAVLSSDKYTVSPGKIEDVNETVITITYTENGETFKTYFEPKFKLRILAPEVKEEFNTIAKTIPFDENVGSDPDVTLKNTSRTTWQTEPNQFGRLRTTNKNAEIIFHHDYSALEDVSLAGFRTMMGVGRGRTVISVGHSTEGPWEVIAKAGEFQNTIPADYKVPCGTVDGKDATDGVNKNVYFCYYKLGKYLAEQKDVYVRFSYAETAPANWLGADDLDGSDLMNNFVFYDKLDLETSTSEDARIPAQLRVMRKADDGENKSNFKTEYKAGEVFDPTGLNIEIIWVKADEETGTPAKTEIVHGVDLKKKGFTWEPSGPLPLGQKTIKFSYLGKNCQVKSDDNFVVKPNSTTAIKELTVKTQPATTEYAAGSKFDDTGLVLEVEFEDGAKADIVKDANVKAADAAVWTITAPEGGVLTAGTEKVTVSYTANNSTKSVDIDVTVLAPAEDAKVVEKELLFTDANNYTLNGGATKDGTSRYFTDESKKQDGALGEAVRLRAQGTAGQSYVQFEYTFEAADVSKAGFMIYLLYSRCGTVVQVSTDGSEFTTIAKVEAGAQNITADYMEKADNIVNNSDGSKTDENMYAMYYSLGKYLTETKKIYIRFLYEKPAEAHTDAAGPDLFGSITFYSVLDIEALKHAAN